MSGCWYTLLLHYNNQRWYLAPRASIDIEEDRDLESFGQSEQGCSSCGQQRDRSYKFKVHFKGGCTLTGAWALHDSLQAFLDAACSAGDLILERQVCRENALVWLVRKASLRMVDTINQRMGVPRVLSMELVLDLTVWTEAGDGVVLVGP